jgi:hypothetical protein
MKYICNFGGIILGTLFQARWTKCNRCHSNTFGVVRTGHLSVATVLYWTSYGSVIQESYFSMINKRGSQVCSQRWIPSKVHETNRNNWPESNDRTAETLIGLYKARKMSSKPGMYRGADILPNTCFLYRQDMFIGFSYRDPSKQPATLTYT